VVRGSIPTVETDIRKGHADVDWALIFFNLMENGFRFVAVCGKAVVRFRDIVWKLGFITYSTR
jgi:hypothetical protein